MFLVVQHCTTFSLTLVSLLARKALLYTKGRCLLKIKAMRGRHILNEFKYCLTRPVNDLFLLNLVMGGSLEELKIVLTAD